MTRSEDFKEFNEFHGKVVESIRYDIDNEGYAAVCITFDDSSYFVAAVGAASERGPSSLDLKLHIAE
jgi:hypothetical protein